MNDSFHTVRCVALATACLVGAVAVQAQTAVMPPMKGSGELRWVCGGIGSDESEAMRAAMKSHPLSLLFARSDGAYLADVDVTIRGAKGAPNLSLRASGPVCLVDLPTGKYTIAATSEGATKSQSVTVGGAPKTADFRF